MRKVEFETSFTVFPGDTNYNAIPCVFGGKMLSEMDACAATVCNRAIYGTECTDVVTVNVQVDFNRPAFIGDIVLISGYLESVGNKSLIVKLSCIREEKRTGKQELMATGKITFVSRKDGTPFPHGLNK